MMAPMLCLELRANTGVDMILVVIPWLDDFSERKLADVVITTTYPTLHAMVSSPALILISIWQR